MNGSNNTDQKQMETNPVIINQPPPIYPYTNPNNIPNFHPGQVVFNNQHGNNILVMACTGIYTANNAMASQMMNVPEYRTWSILYILFCCFVLGIFACVKSNKTRDKKRFGDLQGALKA
jgi:hypothetical protein